MEEPPLHAPCLSDTLYQELRSAVRGEVYQRGDPRCVKPFPVYSPILLIAI